MYQNRCLQNLTHLQFSDSFYLPVDTIDKTSILQRMINMTYKKENKEYHLMNDEVIRPLFKNSRVARELTSKAIS